MPNRKLDIQTLGTNIRHYRKLRGYTQKQLAVLIHCSPSHLARLEAGSCGMSVGIFLKLCNALDCLPSDLLAGAE